MDFTQRFLAFLDAYARKDLAFITAMLAPEVRVCDWNLALQGHAAAVAFMRHNFEQAGSLQIEVLHLHTSENAVAGEVRIVVDGHIELFVVDVMVFDSEGRVRALRSYKGVDPGQPA
ncbi:nuclear transport factor 2 family protein [Rubrivivax rivuli]|uniref:Nuclear transport factor 2 family protein n=1 Tax=Rubrivivax rivuli TaxID=1862385 RepID=A0A437RAZ5_9BURK|nr:nuclear transport factor 2 family protein [Rubrivivax rivuli]RVU43892.1 nuclear transport factor 2 family protein [Rubrivivax rivuli]